MQAIETLARMGRGGRMLGAGVVKWGDGGWIAPGRVVGAAGAGAGAGGAARVKGGGGAVGVGVRPGVGRSANLRVVMNEMETGASGARLVAAASRARAAGSAGKRCVAHVEASLRLLETRDKTDRAHAVRDQDGLLMNGAAVPNARPRRYAPSQLTSRGVSFDSAFDETHARQARLEGIAGVGRASGPGAVSVSASLLERERGGRVARKGRALKGEVSSRGAREPRFLSAEEVIVAAGLACRWR